jgi:hypothetical protein
LDILGLLLYFVIREQQVNHLLWEAIPVSILCLVVLR